MVHIIGDLICRNTGEIYATIDVKNSVEERYWYSGKIVHSKFPKGYLDAINEFRSMVEDMTFSLSDEIEARIYSYNVVIKDLDISIHQVAVEGSNISFFVKYPTGKGFIDDYPNYGKQIN